RRHGRGRAAAGRACPESGCRCPARAVPRHHPRFPRLLVVPARSRRRTPTGRWLRTRCPRRRRSTAGGELARTARVTRRRPLDRLLVRLVATRIACGLAFCLAGRVGAGTTTGGAGAVAGVVCGHGVGGWGLGRWRLRGFRFVCGCRVGGGGRRVAVGGGG